MKKRKRAFSQQRRKPFIEMKKIASQIKRLKEKKNALILAHNYQPPEVQDVADFVGDSLELSRKAVKTRKKMIVFCGVNFMAETAKILNPEKMVITPDPTATCPMADMIDGKILRKLKSKHPKAMVVCYVNTTSAVKAESDICCTSANAPEVIGSVKSPEIIFVPDCHLGKWAAGKTKKKVALYPGFCPVHMKISNKEIINLKKKRPKAKILAHPECRENVKLVSDFILSTGQMIKKVKKIKAKEFVIATEKDMIHRLKKEAPDKNFYHLWPLAVCSNMKKITLPKIKKALENPEKYEIKVKKVILEAARLPIERMLNL